MLTLRTLDDSEAHRASSCSAPGTARDHRRGLDRAGDRGRGTTRRRGGDGPREGRAAAASGCSDRRWPRSSPTCTRSMASTLRMGVDIAEIVGDGGRATGRPPGRRGAHRRRPGPRRRGRPAERRARRRGRSGRGQRSRRRRRAAHLGSRDLGRRRHRQRLPSGARQQIRVEHWDNAKQQGAAAARSILGRTSATTGCRTSSPTSTTWAWSTPATWRPAATTRWCCAATCPAGSSWRSGDPRVGSLAGMGVNIWDAMDPVRALVTSRRVVDADRLRDTSVAHRPRPDLSQAPRSLAGVDELPTSARRALRSSVRITSSVPCHGIRSLCRRPSATHRATSAASY